MSLIVDLITNKIILSVICAYTISSLIKIAVVFILNNKFDFRVFIRTGGMPSSHTASVSALTTAVYLTEGVTNLFIVSLVFSSVFIFDAVSFRRAAGKQAEIINKIVEDYKYFKKLKTKRLYELLGHTPKQVLIGVVLGILIARLIFIF